MTGPAAAARPLLRPGPTLLIKQLSGPAALRSLSPRLPFLVASSSSSTTTTTTTTTRSLSSWSRAPTRQSPLCRSCRLPQRPLRFYSTNPPPSSSDDAPKPKDEPKDASESSPHQEPPSSSSIDPLSSTTTTSPPTSEPNAAQQPEQEQPDPSSSSSSSSSSPTTSPYELPSQADSRRSDLSQNISHVMDNLQSRVLVASQTLNDLTGYSAIESIKAANARLETDLAAAQTELRRARQHYKAVNAQRASTQREVTTLLARKDAWSPLDLERFTTMYRQDHELEAAVAEASTALTEAEAEETRLSQALNSGILKRYHEEQIWSDRIRRQSTWGTWGLMGVNILLFLVLQFVAEPWKRNRLMKGIAAEEKAALEAVQRELEQVKHVLSRREAEEASAATAAAASAAASAAATAAAVAEDGETLEDVMDAEIAAAENAATAAVTSSHPDIVMGLPEAAPIDATFSLPPPPSSSSLWDISWVDSWKDFFLDPSLWRPALEDLCSERRIDLRMRDASLIALQGAVTGAAVVTGVALLLMRWA